MTETSTRVRRTGDGRFVYAYRGITFTVLSKEAGWHVGQWTQAGPFHNLSEALRFAEHDIDRTLG